MVDALIRGILGTAGSRLLDFYLQHSIWINILLFAYAMLVVLARRNYFHVAQLILAGFIQSHGDKLGKKSRNEIRNLLLKWEIPWEDGMRDGRFPFISSPYGLLLRLKSVKTFQKIFTVDGLVETIVQQKTPRSK
jgi:hypothetical protein